MKVLVGLLSVICAAVGVVYTISPDPIKVLTNKVGVDVLYCMEERGIEPRVLRSFVVDQDKYNVSSHLKCFFLCMFSKYRIMDDFDGSIVENNFITRKCREEIEKSYGHEDGCNKADRLRKCLSKQYTAEYFETMLKLLS